MEVIFYVVLGLILGVFVPTPGPWLVAKIKAAVGYEPETKPKEPTNEI